MLKAIRKKSCRGMRLGDISYEELKNMVRKGATLLDVRSIQEYKEGHLRGAIQIADYEIYNKIKKIIPNKKCLIVIYCTNGGRSRKAYNELKKQGYENVFNLYGGLDSI